jgi:hypothetical protein
VHVTCPSCASLVEVPADAQGAADGYACPSCTTVLHLPAPLSDACKPVWHVARGKKKTGPFTLLQLREMGQSAALSPTDMVLQSSAQKWVKAGSVDGLFVPVAVCVLGAVPRAQVPALRRRAHPAVLAAAVVLLLAGGVASVVAWRGIGLPAVVADYGAAAKDSAEDAATREAEELRKKQQTAIYGAMTRGEEIAARMKSEKARGAWTSDVFRMGRKEFAAVNIVDCPTDFQAAWLKFERLLGDAVDHTAKYEGVTGTLEAAARLWWSKVLDEPSMNPITAEDRLQAAFRETAIEIKRVALKYGVQPPPEK